MSSGGRTIPQTLWGLQIPLYITHASLPNTPFVASVPRFSYLALLLPRLQAYFGLPCSSFHHEDVLLRNLAVGLLIDLYQPTLPWRLTVGDGMSWDIGDTFLNSAKEVRLHCMVPYISLRHATCCERIVPWGRPIGYQGPGPWTESLD